MLYFYLHNSGGLIISSILDDMQCKPPIPSGYMVEIEERCISCHDIPRGALSEAKVREICERCHRPRGKVTHVFIYDRGVGDDDSY